MLVFERLRRSCYAAIAVTLNVIGCSDDGGSGTGADDCARCEAGGGICEGGCYASNGQTSVGCYHPREPGPDQFSCDGLLNCNAGSVCLDQKPPGDGCYQHVCIAPPAGCEEDVTCACIATKTSGRCTDTGLGVRVEAGGNPPWKKMF